MYAPDVQRTRHFFLIVQAAVTPTRVLPAPTKEQEQKMSEKEVSHKNATHTYHMAVQ